jgi:hypothetical protein
MLNEYRAWNKDQKIMVYNNEDNDRGFWDGVNLSSVEMANARLANSEYYPYIWMQLLYIREDGEKFYDGDVVSLSNPHKYYCIKKLDWNIGYGLYSYSSGEFLTALNKDQFEKFTKVGNIHEMEGK